MEPDVELSKRLVVKFVCPVCKGPLQQRAERYICTRDRREYAAILGIPDFRIFPYGPGGATESTLTKRLVAAYFDRAFADLLDLYESLNSPVPADVRAKRRVHLSTGVVRAESCLSEIVDCGALSARDKFLEIGCGTGAFLLSAAQVFRCIVGLDISMPRLVLAKKQLEEVGRPVILVCAAAEALPFSDNVFHLVVGSDVIEHVQEQDRVMLEVYRVLAPGSALFLATPNRWSLTPEPHVNLWGVGFLPKTWRALYVWFARKIRYGNISLLNWFEIRRLIVNTPFDRWHIILPTLPSEHTARLPAWARGAAPIYHALKGCPLLKWLVNLFGPLFHVICIKK